MFLIQSNVSFTIITMSSCLVFRLKLSGIYWYLIFRQWDVRTLKETNTITLDKGLSGMQLSRDQSILCVASGNTAAFYDANRCVMYLSWSDCVDLVKHVYVQGLILKNKLGVGNIAEKAETLFYTPNSCLA